MERPSRWVYLLPSLHLSGCLASYFVLLIPGLKYLGILFSFVLLADLPISIPAYLFGWKYPALAAIWIFLAGTLWWYLLSRGVIAICARSVRGNREGPAQLFGR